MTKQFQSRYRASLTRRQFLFHEMRTTARLVMEGFSGNDVAKKIIEENLFQYPTERSIRDLANHCIERLMGLDDPALIRVIAEYPSDVSKQVCLYAMMKQSQLVFDFMVGVIGEKYRQQDLSFSKLDMNAFFIRLQEQDDVVASWSESTINKIKQVLLKIMVETGYLDSTKSKQLNPVLIDTALLNSIQAHNDDAVLPAFNNF